MFDSQPTPSDQARSARAELEVIVSALRAESVTQLVAMGRRLLHDELREDGREETS